MKSMSNPPVQTAAQVNEAAPSTELAERLLRRRDQPLGLIDMRHPQQQYTRTAGWAVRRFALLDHWKTRYGGDEGASAHGTNLVFAAQRQPLTEADHLPSSPAQLARLARQSVAFEPGAAAATPPTEQFRVRRR